MHHSKIKYAIIGGTGMGNMFNTNPQFFVEKMHREKTPYGDGVYYTIVRRKGGHKPPCIFIDRHNSSGQFRLPHQLNHAAYMWLLRTYGVKYVFAISAVGGLNGALGHIRLKTGSLIMPSDYFDLTGRAYTFADESTTDPVKFHRAVDPPFCPRLRTLLKSSDIIDGGQLGCVIVGPRYETRAELNILKAHQASLAGMNTIAGEVPLAHELAAHYVAICCVTNMPLEKEDTDATKIAAMAKKHQAIIIDRIFHAMTRIDAGYKYPCACRKHPSVFSR